MSTTSMKSSSAFTKRLVYSVTSMSMAALLMFLPQTHHALALVSRPAKAAGKLLRPVGMILPGAHDFWHTEGNRIVDTHSRPVRISGMNWSGFETTQAVPGGLEAQDYRTILRTIKRQGYNTVRIPFSSQMIEMPSVPERVGFSNGEGSINTDLRNLNSLEILDKIVDYSGSIGLKVILDNHRSEAGSSAQESGLWYTTDFPESAWISDWTMLAHRYKNTSTVIGMDLRNEPHNADKGGACWDCGGQNDWHRAAQRAGNAILTVNPHLLIFVEGVDTYAGDSYWWGGNLEGVRRSPVHLAVADRLVYSVHEYGPSEYSQPWFDASTSPATLASVWRRHWAYVSEAGIAPVWIGEFGTSNVDSDVESSEPGSEGQWFTTLVQFLSSHPSVGWTYWGINGEDRYGLLDANYAVRPSNSLKSAALASIANGTARSFAASTETAPAAFPTFPTSYSTPAAVAIAPFAPATRPGRTFMTPKTAAPLERSSIAQKAAMRPSTPSDGTISDAALQSAIAANIHRAVSKANLSLRDEGAVGVVNRGN